LCFSFPSFSGLPSFARFFIVGVDLFVFFFSFFFFQFFFTSWSSCFPQVPPVTTSYLCLSDPSFFSPALSQFSLSDFHLPSFDFFSLPPCPGFPFSNPVPGESKLFRKECALRPLQFPRPLSCVPFFSVSSSGAFIPGTGDVIMPPLFLFTDLFAMFSLAELFFVFFPCLSPCALLMGTFPGRSFEGHFFSLRRTPFFPSTGPSLFSDTFPLQGTRSHPL